MYLGRPLKFLTARKDFLRLFLAQVISQMGDFMYHVAIIWMVLELTGSKASVGTVAMTAYLPVLVFGLLAGVASDLFDRRRIMLTVDGVRFVLVLALPLAHVLGQLHLAVIYGVTFFLFTGAAFFNPARDALVPSLVEPDELVRSNALIQVSMQLAILFGPSFAGVVIHAVGIYHVFTINALTFAVSAWLIYSIRIDWIQRSGPAAAGETVRTQFRELLRFVYGKRRLRFLLGLTAVNNFFIMGPAIVGAPIFVREVLGRGAGSYAIVESSYGLGMVVGSVMVNWLTRRLNKGRVLLLAMVFDGLTYALIFWTRSMELLVLIIIIHSVGIPNIIVPRTALIQEWIEDRMLGRVFGLVNIAVVGVTALTSASTGRLAEYVPIQQIYLLFGLAAAACGVVGWLNPDLREG